MPTVTSLIMPGAASTNEIDEFVTTTMKRVGDLSDIKLFGNRVLVAKYDPATIGSGKLIAAASTRKENGWQGKIGLVLKVGTTAFVSDANYDFGGDEIKEGDWVTFMMSSGTDVALMEAGKWGKAAEIDCKILRDIDLIMKIPEPTRVF